MGAAVGILITVPLVAAAAVVLVLVRNRVGKAEALNIFLLCISGAPEIPGHLLTLFGKSDGLSRKHQVL